ncbi:putative amidoligase enzyme-domain-containing protein [Xylaria arbuscula]|nr:putative amidoligase enzyme-domain-containing protein [Xylaria arbuscula]
MSISTSRSPERPTFGVEVEFIIATLPDRFLRRADPHTNVKGLPPVLRVPGTNPRTITNYVQEKVKGVLQECFGTLPDIFVPRIGIKSERILDLYRDWTVEEDDSINTEDEKAYKFVGVEIASPAQYSSPKGFNAIYLAISAITSRFRCKVNISCGLHVHVGLGTERLPLEHVRRLASLYYAVEPLLFTLHSPLRKDNIYSRAIQDHTYISREGKGKDIESDMPHSLSFSFQQGNGHCQDYLGHARRHGEAPMSERDRHADEAYVKAFLETRQPGHFEPFTRSGDSRHTMLLMPDDTDVLVSAAALASSTVPPAERARQRSIKRLRFPRYSPVELDNLRRKLGPSMAAFDFRSVMVRGDRREPLSVFEAVERIYQQPASCYISHLLSGDMRPALNLRAVGCASLTPGALERTVEFRLGEGSLEPEWISTWAKICVGIFKFALYSSPSQFIDVLTDCDRATKEDGCYDIIDFLDDIGLIVEAEIAEKRLMANKDQWDLKFVEPES